MFYLPAYESLACVLLRDPYRHWVALAIPLPQISACWSSWPIGIKNKWKFAQQCLAVRLWSKVLVKCRRVNMFLMAHYH